MLPPDSARSRPIPPDSARFRPIPPDSTRFSPAPSKNTGVLANDGCGPIPPGPARSRPIPPDSARSRPILHALHDEKLVARTLETKKSANSTPCGPFSFLGGDFRDPLRFGSFAV